MQEDVGQLVLEGRGILLGGEVGTLATPRGDRAGDAADHLLDRALALGMADLPAKVLLGDDIGGVLAPSLGKLDVGLLEGDAVAVTDAGVAQLPLDRLEGVRIRGGEQALDGQGLTEACVLRDRGVRGEIHRPHLLCAVLCDAHSTLFTGGSRILARAPDRPAFTSILEGFCAFTGLDEPSQRTPPKWPSRDRRPPAASA